MAELTEVIKLSKPVKMDLEDIKDKEKHSSLDSVIRNIIEKNMRLEAVDKLIKIDLQKCKKENKELKSKLKEIEKKEQGTENI